ncbi:uncharacterized protein LOC141797900 [Halichoeres trimaculatus]|uniref:uncharacterized protein LOC141797900 n=1 Tax=Halichoeres trimaculatus TaxID=147232 RepID=UPI003D9DC8DA
MSASWREDDEDYRVGGVKGVVLKSKPRFSFHEIKVLLEAVKRNRYILLRKFNQGVSADTKKQTWVEITNQINALGENHREVRQIMKKWADLKCDGKRRLVALRGVNGHPAKKKNMGPVERMVHKILMMSPKGNGDSDLDLCEDEDFTKVYSDTPLSNPSPYSYLSMTDSSHSVPDRYSFDMSPLSSPENDASGDPFHSSSEFDLDPAEDGEQSMDFDDSEDALFSSYPPSLPPPPSSLQEQEPLPDGAQMRKPVHTYSRNSSQSNNNNNHVQNNTSSRPAPEASTSSAPPPPAVSDSDAAEVQPTTSSNIPASSFVPPLPPASSSSSSTVSANDATSKPASSSSSILPAPAAPSSSNSKPPPSSSPSPSSRPNKSSTQSSSDPLPAGASSRRVQDHVAQMASQSLEQQRASRMLLASVSQSLEVLAQSVQLLVESQQEFVQESLMLQRETVDVLRDFSNTALTMLRDKANSGQVQARHHQHPASHF